MKRSLTCLVRAASGVACLWAATAGAVTMSVNGTSGPAKTFDVTSIRKIAYDLSATPKMNVVLATNATLTIDIAAIRSITFTGFATPAQRGQVKRIKSDLISFVMRKGAMPSVSFLVEKPEIVTIAIFTITGELVRSVADRRFEAGDHTIFWDGTNGQGSTACSGNYIIKIDRASHTSAFKFVTVR